MAAPETGEQRGASIGGCSATSSTIDLRVVASTSDGHVTPNGDRMDISPSTAAAMGPPSLSSPDAEPVGRSTSVGAGATEMGNSNHTGVGGGLGAAAAAAAAQQPKVVQTAFIHKLYKYVVTILED